MEDMRRLHDMGCIDNAYMKKLEADGGRAAAEDAAQVWKEDTRSKQPIPELSLSTHRKIRKNKNKAARKARAVARG